MREKEPPVRARGGDLRRRAFNYPRELFSNDRRVIRISGPNFRFYRSASFGIFLAYTEKRERIRYVKCGDLCILISLSRATL